VGKCVGGVLLAVQGPWFEFAVGGGINLDGQAGAMGIEVHLDISQRLSV
jgi:hypothetical protein